MRQVLTSWKEIAAHFGKGVRTVQRWERDLGLPVRRSPDNAQNIIFARPEELDQWLDSLPCTARNADRIDTILLAEGDGVLGGHLRTVLEEAGFQVVSSSETKSAITMWSARRRQYSGDGNGDSSAILKAISARS